MRAFNAHIAVTQGIATRVEKSTILCLAESMEPTGDWKPKQMRNWQKKAGSPEVWHWPLSDSLTCVARGQMIQRSICMLAAVGCSRSWPSIGLDMHVGGERQWQSSQLCQDGLSHQDGVAKLGPNRGDDQAQV